MKFELDKLVRKNIRSLTPYSSARHEFTGVASVFLDANENSYGTPLTEKYNRYPDPLQRKLKDRLAALKETDPANIFIGNGSDEVIDIAYRIFCEPGKDNVIICPPTYGMYEVSANINDVKVNKINLTKDFQLDTRGIIDSTGEHSKLLFVCSPNNPTGNSMNRKNIEFMLENFPGIVMLDEAYISYSKYPSLIGDLKKYPNLVVMQTLSKAWGMAALRLGLCFASADIIDLFNKVKPPYNVNGASQKYALEALEEQEQVDNWIGQILEQRDLLEIELKQFPFIEKIFSSDANFLLIKVKDANSLYQYLSGKGIIVRNRSREVLCENCLRITIGTSNENQKLINVIKNYE